METSRYTRYSKSRLPKRKRTLRIQGAFEDANKYQRCWNCGFIVDAERDLTDSDNSGCYQTDINVPAESPTGSGANPIITIEGLDACCMIENGADGNAITDYYTPRNPLVARGCPLCGCVNL